MGASTFLPAKAANTASASVVGLPVKPPINALDNAAMVFKYEFLDLVAGSVLMAGLTWFCCGG